MPSTTPRPSQLFNYLLPHQVLICKECRYAIKPPAISRHLKELHRIYDSDRHEFMEYAQSLDLADPRDDILPEPNEVPRYPVPFLLTTSGLVIILPSQINLDLNKKLRNKIIKNP
jgi:hypothetical protein